ncbi:hypothetical protein DICVIV_13371 [Dictyocaulus viviparus]|uniref:Uncharacterized protein n=1 Tax=Dictyocaulus viviparus TaxID=29172 RepID=A0A0D8X7Y5_DICVI|nr:hypothetical protein DICVIV_13371 [Dictyocaulus viviparus]
MRRVVATVCFIGIVVNRATDFPIDSDSYVVWYSSTPSPFDVQQYLNISENIPKAGISTSERFEKRKNEGTSKSVSTRITQSTTSTVSSNENEMLSFNEPSFISN